jgi:hypothetical protein
MEAHHAGLVGLTTQSCHVEKAPDQLSVHHHVVDFFVSFRSALVYDLKGMSKRWPKTGGQ